MSWLPVPRRPETDQVSITSASRAGNRTSLMSGLPLGSSRGASPSNTMQPPISQSQFSTLLAKRQRPLTSSWPSRASARPEGAKTPPATAAGSPKTSRAGSSSR